MNTAFYKPTDFRSSVSNNMASTHDLYSFSFTAPNKHGEKKKNRAVKIKEKRKENKLCRRKIFVFDHSHHSHVVKDIFLEILFQYYALKKITLVFISKSSGLRLSDTR